MEQPHRHDRCAAAGAPPHLGVDERRRQERGFNVVNGDVFRWKWRWPRLADRMADAPAQWAAIAAKHQLREPDIDRLASWWQAGFLDFQSTPDAFTDLFQRLEAERIIPKR